MNELEQGLRKNRVLSQILNRVPSLSLRNWYLGAGCIAQTIWNELHGFEPTAHIKDYDLVYFDDSDLSFEAEDFILRKVKKLFGGELNDRIEIKNEARVHLWHQERFGYEISPYKSVEDAISSWPTTATSIGVKLDEKGKFFVYAPYGVDDLYALVVRPNKKQVTKEIYEEKVRRWTKLWPLLRVVSWEESAVR